MWRLPIADMHEARLVLTDALIDAALGRTGAKPKLKAGAGKAKPHPKMKPNSSEPAARAPKPRPENMKE